MSEEATIEDEAEAEQQQPFSSRPETKTGLLTWSYIFEIATKQWAIFLILSIAIAVFLYINGHRRRSQKDTSAAVRRDHVQGGSKGTPPKSPKKRA